MLRARLRVTNSYRIFRALFFSLFSVCSKLILSTQEHRNMAVANPHKELEKAKALLSGINAMSDVNLTLIETETDHGVLLEKLAKNSTHLQTLSALANDSLRIMING